MIHNPEIHVGVRARREEEPNHTVIGFEQGVRFLVLVILGLILVTNCAKAAASNMGSLHQDNQWLKEHLLNDTAQPPFSFAYDRQGSSALLKAWPRKTETTQLDDIRTEHTRDLD